MSESDAEKSIDATKSGDVGAHAWNSEVADRMESYNPPILAIDSVYPSHYATNGADFDYRAALWNLLPGKPSDINGSDEVFVVAGDITYGEADPNSLIPFELRLATLWGGAYLGYKAGQAAYGALRDKTAKSERPHSWPYDQEAEEQREAVERDPTQMTPDQLTRRRFFGQVGAGIAVGAAFSSWLAAYSPFNVPRDVAGSVDQAYQSVSLDRIIDWDNNYDYIDGRTALLISKLGDSMRWMGLGALASGAVLMGKDHLDQSDSLLKDGDLRNTYIRQQAMLMTGAAKDDTKFFGGHWTPRERMRWVLDMQRKIQIFRVTEPDDEAFKAHPKAELKRIIEQVDEFYSPSVTKATQNVIDPQLLPN